MPIDTSIYGNIKPVQIENPLENYGKLIQLQQAQQQNRLADLVYGEKQREIGGDNALASLLAGGKSGADVSQGLAAAGYGTKALAYTKSLQEQEKQRADIGKTKAETSYKEVEAAHKRVELIGQGLGYLKDNPTMENAQGIIKHFVDVGIMPPEVAQQKLADFQRDPSPEGIRSLALMGYQGALSAKDQLPKIETRNLGGTTDTLSIDPVSGKVVVANSVKNTESPDAVLSSETARRGQNISASTAAAGRAQADRHFTLSQASGKVPAGYRANADGSLSFIPGGPADPKSESGKAPTEFQGKSAGFGARAEEADRILTGLTGKYSPAAVNSKVSVGSVPLIGGVMGAITNKFALNDSDQRAEQAQRDFINAVLRQESGAAIGASEFDNAAKQYFPQPGDTAGVIAQKAKNRKLAIAGFKQSAGKAAFSAPADAGDIHSQADAILRGGK